MGTLHREILDKHLDATRKLIKLPVLDIGGKKHDKRGKFRPNIDLVEEWKYLNIDSATAPDFCCDATEIPIEKEQFKTIMLNEVIEHVEEPEKVLREAYRVMLPDGLLILSMPFMFHKHGDPFDYQRWTDTKIIKILNSVGFVSVNIVPLGGVGTIIHDTLGFAFSQMSIDGQKIGHKIAHKLLQYSKWIFRYIDRLMKTSESKATGGWFVTAKKPL